MPGIRGNKRKRLAMREMWSRRGFTKKTTHERGNHDGDFCVKLTNLKMCHSECLVGRTNFNFPLINCGLCEGYFHIQCIGLPEGSGVVSGGSSASSIRGLYFCPDCLESLRRLHRLALPSREREARFEAMQALVEALDVEQVLIRERLDRVSAVGEDLFARMSSGRLVNADYAALLRENAELKREFVEAIATNDQHRFLDNCAMTNEVTEQLRTVVDPERNRVRMTEDPAEVEEMVTAVQSGEISTPDLPEETVTAIQSGEISTPDLPEETVTAIQSEEISTPVHLESATVGIRIESAPPNTIDQSVPNESGQVPTTEETITPMEITETDVRHLPRKKIRQIKSGSRRIPVDDNYLYCIDCDRLNLGDCRIHGSPKRILDSIVFDNDPEMALNSLPFGLLIRKTAGLATGVWTEMDIPRGVMFGPFKGKLVPLDSLKEPVEPDRCWLIRNREKATHIVDACDVTCSNWLRFVNCADDTQPGNLSAFQYKGHIFYRSTKPISKGLELLLGDDDDEVAPNVTSAPLDDGLPVVEQSLLRASSNVDVSSIRPLRTAENSTTPPNVVVSPVTLQPTAISPKVVATGSAVLRVAYNQTAAPFLVAGTGSSRASATVTTAIATQASPRLPIVDPGTSIVAVNSGSSAVSPRSSALVPQIAYKSCHVCRLVFTEEEMVQHHREAHNLEPSYTCSSCSQVFATYFLMCVHASDVHGEHRSLSCEICHLQYPGYVELLQHWTKEHSITSNVGQTAPPNSNDVIDSYSPPPYQTPAQLQRGLADGTTHVATANIGQALDATPTDSATGASLASSVQHAISPRIRNPTRFSVDPAHAITHANLLHQASRNPSNPTLAISPPAAVIYHCDVCHKRFTFRDQCLQHLQTKHGINNYNTTFTPTGISAPTVSTVTSQTQQPPPAPPPSLTAPAVTSQPQSSPLPTLQRHSSSNGYLCNACQASFLNVEDALQHLKAVHNVNNPAFFKAVNRSVTLDDSSGRVAAPQSSRQSATASTSTLAQPIPNNTAVVGPFAPNSVERNSSASAYYCYTCNLPFENLAIFTEHSNSVVHHRRREHRLNTQSSQMNPRLNVQHPAAIQQGNTLQQTAPQRMMNTTQPTTSTHGTQWNVAQNTSGQAAGFMYTSPTAAAFVPETGVRGGWNNPGGSQPTARLLPEQLSRTTQPWPPPSSDNQRS